MNLRRVRAGVLDIAYEEHGTPGDPAVVLLHGFPYDVRAFDGAVEALGGGLHVIVPYLRGFGATRFLDGATLRSGQQGALGADLLALLDALGVERAIVGGYDWGGRAACILAALHPQRTIGLATAMGYNIQNIASALEPIAPANEVPLWYQYYFHNERGRRALARHPAELCKLLWRMWSPEWRFDDATFARTAPSFENADFSDVVAHSYRHRFGLVPGDPAYDEIEAALARQPRIEVPVVALYGLADTVGASAYAAHDRERFGADFERVDLAGIGHNIPQEAPAEFAAAVRRLAARA